MQGVFFKQCPGANWLLNSGMSSGVFSGDSRNLVADSLILRSNDTIVPRMGCRRTTQLASHFFGRLAATAAPRRSEHGECHARETSS
jgi:hypothetical protein